MEINGLKPYTNTLDQSGKVIELAWCHDTMTKAMDYWRYTSGEEISYADLLDRWMTLAGIQALLYGALSSGVDMSLDDFARFYRADNLEIYMDVVMDGLTHYLPQPDADDLEPERLDEEWPETRQPEKKKENACIDFGGWFAALKKLGYSLAEIGQLTWPGMLEIMRIERGEPANDYAWLDGDGYAKGAM